jgi:hypothetical protein
MLYCHNCLRETSHLICDFCQSEFVEEIQDEEPMEMQVELNPFGGILTALLQGLQRTQDTQEEARQEEARQEGPATRSRTRMNESRNNTTFGGVTLLPGAFPDDERPQDVIRDRMMRQIFDHLQMMQGGIMVIPQGVSLDDYAMGAGGLDDILTRLMGNESSC